MKSEANGLLLALGLCCALSAPAAAQTFDAQYNVDFTINGIDQVLGDIDVSCGNGCLITNWQFTVTGIADGEQGITSTISSAAGGTINQAASPLAYTATGLYISAEGGGGGGLLQFTGGNNNNGGGQLSITTESLAFAGDDSGLGASESFDNPNGSEVQIGTIDPQPLPAPTLGEGLPGLAFGAALVLLWRRRWAVL